MGNVVYKSLKNNIIKACRRADNTTNKFSIDAEKLNESVKDYNLELVNTNLISRLVKDEDIPLLAEYFTNSKLSWFTDDKYITTLIFVSTENMTDELRGLLDDLKKNPVEDVNIDRIALLSNLVANFHCYYATIAAYQSNSPGRVGKLSYEIICRANKVVIRDTEYKYNADDV